MRLGIDFGTTRTVIAAVRDGRYPVASFETRDGFVDYLPGLATAGPGGLAFGTDAESSWDQAAAQLTPLLRSVKETVTGAAPDETVAEILATGVSALDLATDYLRYVRRMLLHHSNLDIAEGEPLEAMIAVPAQASTQQRYLTMEAFAGAGFSVLGLVNEPTAGAVEYARHSLATLSARSPKRYVIVYDLGGGTFDAAAVSLVDRRFDLIGAEGISRLGGNDFDEIIAAHALDRLGARRDELSPQEWSHLLERCRHAKETLSNNSRKMLVDLTGLPTTDEVLLDVNPIYESSRPLVERSLETLQQLFEQLRAHGIDPENSRELGAIYLVGGSVQFPAVQRALRRAFPRKVQLAPQPHASTAIGLAVAADDEADVFLREAPTRHFGVWREGDAGREKVFDPIIEKRAGTPIDGPLEIHRSYFPAHAVGLLRFVECSNLDEGRQPTGEVTPWQNVLFPYDPVLSDCADLQAHAGDRSTSVLAQEIVETYEYTPAGMIRVRIANRSSGYEREFVLGGEAARETPRLQ